MTPLDEMCQLIAQVGTAKAIEFSDVLQSILEEVPIELCIVSRADVRRKLVTGFACMNWVLATGVWSNLKNAKLRQDLMIESKTKMVLVTAQLLNRDGAPEDVAAAAVKLEFDEFQPFMRECINRFGELERQGKTPDADSVLLIALGWILNNLGLSRKSIDKVMFTFLIRVDDFASIEEIAQQVNRAASKDRRRA